MSYNESSSFADINCSSILSPTRYEGSLSYGSKTIFSLLTWTKLPLIIDAGLGQASDASIAMELGCDGVLINTAIAMARNPIQMAEAMKFAVQAGRKSFLSGRIKKTIYGKASSPKTGLI